MRVLSSSVLREMFAPESDECAIVLLTITHDDLVEPIRVSTNPTQRLDDSDPKDIVYGTVSRDERYIYMPCKIVLPDETDEGGQTMKIEMDNVHRTQVEAIRSVSTPPSLDAEIVMASDPDTVEMRWPEYRMTNVHITTPRINATLSLELLDRETFPSGTFNPADFPGLFS